MRELADGAFLVFVEFFGVGIGVDGETRLEKAE
jgi:hypothetical protein